MNKYKQKLDSFFEKITENKIIKIRLDELNFHPELEQAFHIDEEVKKRIEDDVRANGNNTKAHPIHIFKYEGKWYVSDGHTRVTVLRALGYTYAWAQVHVFESVSEALCHTMSEQFNRRNETDAMLLAKYLALREKVQNGKKLSAEEMAKRLNKSRRFVFMIRSVFSKSSKEQLDSIKDGSASINSVYQAIKHQKAGESESEQEKSTEVDNPYEIEDSEESSESVDENPGNDSDSVPTVAEETATVEKSEDDTTEGTASANPEKPVEKSVPRYLTDKQYFMLGVKYAFMQSAKGKTSQQVMNAIKNLPDSLSKEVLKTLKEV